MAHAVDQAAHDAGGSMDITEQVNTFQGFLKAALWMCTFVAMSVSLLVVAFAIGAGWFAGLGAFAAVGIGAGLFLRMPTAFWIAIGAITAALAVGGAIVLAVI